MAGYYSRQGYDEQAYQEELQRSVGKFNYRLAPYSTVHCDSCFPFAAPVPPEREDVSLVRYINTESKLKNLDRKNSKANRASQPSVLTKEDEYSPRLCGLGIQSQSTRYTHPAYEIKGMTKQGLHFDYPLYDPQCNIFENRPINTHLQAIDNHRTIWQEPYCNTFDDDNRINGLVAGEVQYTPFGKKMKY